MHFLQYSAAPASYICEYFWNLTLLQNVMKPNIQLFQCTMMPHDKAKSDNSYYNKQSCLHSKNHKTKTFKALKSHRDTPQPWHSHHKHSKVKQALQKVKKIEHLSSDTTKEKQSQPPEVLCIKLSKVNLLEKTPKAIGLFTKVYSHKEHTLKTHRWAWH